MIPPYMIQLRKLLNSNMLWGGDPANRVKLICYKMKNFNIYLIDITKIISILPNLIDQITFFFRNIRHLSHTNLFIDHKKKKKRNDGWIDDKIESWVVNNDSTDDKERLFLIQFSTLTLMIEKRIDQILSSFAHNVI
ncbi:hypothetical protein KPL71_000610 [Citrus sinensis]|uniref:Uncharacterized protein n=1 Tax=Citrus sinensis TaxID=2711 RepID=A0ACB8NR75_CITSI|nr:hypothetical protein KPL71_000610 [Citrus sinensis]